MLDDAWQVLQRAGIPLGAGRRGPIPLPEEIGRAIEKAAAKAIGREREALCALVLAWSHGWPRSFVAAFGQKSEPLLSWAAGQFEDVNRYLKLRRIALANLAEVL